MISSTVIEGGEDDDFIQRVRMHPELIPVIFFCLDHYAPLRLRTAGHDPEV